MQVITVLGAKIEERGTVPLSLSTSRKDSMDIHTVYISLKTISQNNITSNKLASWRVVGWALWTLELFNAKTLMLHNEWQ